jgi:putative membrane protein
LHLPDNKLFILNEVPMSIIARGIEIDLRQMMDEENDFIPRQFPEEDHVRM